MLTKIEEAYLHILRVVVLIAATLALIGAVLGVVRAAPATAPATSDDGPGGTAQPPQSISWQNYFASFL